MQIIYHRIAGLVKGRYTIPEELKVGDVLGLMEEPTNKYDKNAVQIFYIPEHDPDDCSQIGYIASPKNPHAKYFTKDEGREFSVECDFQKVVRDEGITEARVTACSPKTKTMSPSITICLLKDGEPWGRVAQSVEQGTYISPVAGSSPAAPTKYRHYKKGGERVTVEAMILAERKEKGLYMSITSFIGMHFPVDPSLDAWAKQTVTRENLEDRAHIGNKVHQGIDAAFKWAQDKKLTFVECAVRVFDDELMLAGEIDGVFEENDSPNNKVIAEWKTGKIVYKHKMQTAFYTDTFPAERGEVVGVISDTKKGYSECKPIDIDEQMQKIRDKIT